MTSQYTKDVTKAIKDIAKKCSKIVDIKTEDNIWIGPPKGTNKQGTYFVSDITFEMKNSKVIIFQLCDTQANDPKKIFGDFFTAFLAREVKNLYFIIPPEKETEINNICSTSLSILKNRYDVKESRIISHRVFVVKKGSYEDITERIKILAHEERWGYNE